MNLAYAVVDVFANTTYAGNPLAIVYAPDEGVLQLGADQMQAIAAEMNLSETVFVTRWDWAVGQFALRIFTPSKELPFAGHPSIGTAAWLARRAPDTSGLQPITLMEAIGPIACEARWQGDVGHATLTPARLPQRLGEAAPAREVVAAALGLPVDALSGAIEIWSSGLAVHCVALDAPERIAAIRPPAINGALQGLDLACFAYGPGDDTVSARVFPLAAGIVEDPATGAAAVALAGRMAKDLLSQRSEARVCIHQGVDMGRPSELRLHLRGGRGALQAVQLSGDVVDVAEGRLLRLPSSRTG